MAARLRIIILKRTRDDADTIEYIMWANFPSGRESHYKDPATPPTRVSAWDKATVADNTELQEGRVYELVTTQRSPTGTGMAALQTILQQNWTAFQNEVTNFNPWQRTDS